MKSTKMILYIILWPITFICPWLVFLNSPLFNNPNPAPMITSPLWGLNLETPETIWISSTSWFFLFFRTNTFFDDSYIIYDGTALFYTLVIGLPLIFSLLILEFVRKNIVSPKYAKPLAMWYPIILLFLPILLYIVQFGIYTSIGFVGQVEILFIPVPIASVGHYLMYRKMNREYEEKQKSLMRDEPKALPSEAFIDALRGGEFVGNRFRYKVKVINNSDSVFTDIVVTLLSYPKDSLKLEGESVRRIAKLEPKGFRSPTFDFLPTQDCVKGDIIANTAFVDSKGKAHSITTEPFTIRAVCDLLKPETVTPEEFAKKLVMLNSGEMTIKVDDWTPEEMNEKTLNIIRNSNFFEVTSTADSSDDIASWKISGWARGIYTGKSIGIQVAISGKPGVRGTTCIVRISGEDEAMIMPAIDEISQKLSAWLCPKCGGNLSIPLVNELKVGKSIACPFCGVTMDR